MINLDALLSAIQERKAQAQDAAFLAGQFWSADDIFVVAGDESQVAAASRSDVATFIAANSPAAVLRQCEADLELLELHAPVLLRGGPGGKYYETATVCRSCSPPQFAEEAWPCPTIRNRAHAYAIPTEETERR